MKESQDQILALAFRYNSSGDSLFAGKLISQNAFID
jgi:hypothetical protein